MKTATTLSALAVLLAGCASDGSTSNEAYQAYRKDHVACYQRAAAVGNGGSTGATINSHVYLLCMRDKGRPV